MRVLFLRLLRCAPLVGLALAAGASAQDPIPVSLPDTLIYVEPGAVAGTPVRIPIRVGTDVTGRGISNADIIVSFDPDVVSFTSRENGNFYPGCGSPGFPSDPPGEFRVTIACGSGSPFVGGPGTLLTLVGSLVGTDAGTSSLVFVDQTPFNRTEGRDQVDVPVSVTNGRIRVVTDPDPNLGAVDAQTVEEDGTLGVELTLSDQDTPLESVTVTAQSSSALVASGGLAVETCEGQDASSPCRVLRVTPATDASGTATITVTVSDGDARSQDTSTSFALTVTPVNDAPTVAAEVPDRSEPAASTPFEIDLTSVFADVDDATLQYTATSSVGATATVTVDGTMVTVTPVQFGTATITLQATDAAGLSAEDAFTLTVTAGVSTDPGAPTAFAVHGSAPNPATGSASVVLDLPSPAEVRVEVYDTAGRQVLGASAGVLAAGAGHRVPLDLAGFPAGVYVYRVTAQLGGSAQSASGQLVVVR